jgi:hypothetical protein
MKKFVFAALTASITSLTFAAAVVSNAKVVQVRVNSDGTGMVIFDQNLSGSASCVAAGYGNMLSFSNTSGGKQALALALTAKTTGGTITAYGLGTCNNTGGAEDWNAGFLN